ncbi:MAG: hypothetical protein O3B45_00910 [Bacteroidetes bacterium]|jgi:antitoxin component YwqK of YwqJK toxin-antitoxin module|nr:hypothetical protein [Bacteroidota bacterium]
MRFAAILLTLACFVQCAPQPEQVVTAAWPDGTAKREVTLAEGDSTAVRTFYPTGALEKIGFYESGEKTGDWNAWYAHGTPWSEHHYVHGIQVGSYRTWHPNGAPFITGSYNDQGTPDGTWTFQDDEGNLLRTVDGAILNP